MAELPPLKTLQPLILTLASIDEYDLSGSISTFCRSTALGNDQYFDLDRPFNHFDFLSYDEACIAYENATKPSQYICSRRSSAIDMDPVLRWDGLQRKQSPWDFLKKVVLLFSQENRANSVKGSRAI